MGQVTTKQLTAAVLPGVVFFAALLLWTHHSADSPASDVRGRTLLAVRNVLDLVEGRGRAPRSRESHAFPNEGDASFVFPQDLQCWVGSGEVCRSKPTGETSSGSGDHATFGASAAVFGAETERQPLVVLGTRACPAFLGAAPLPPASREGLRRQFPGLLQMPDLLAVGQGAAQAWALQYDALAAMTPRAADDGDLRRLGLDASKATVALELYHALLHAFPRFFAGLPLLEAAVDTAGGTDGAASDVALRERRGAVDLRVAIARSGEKSMTAARGYCAITNPLPPPLPSAAAQRLAVKRHDRTAAISAHHFCFASGHSLLEWKLKSPDAPRVLLSDVEAFLAHFREWPPRIADSNGTGGRKSAAPTMRAKNAANNGGSSSGGTRKPPARVLTADEVHLVVTGFDDSSAFLANDFGWIDHIPYAKTLYVKPAARPGFRHHNRWHRGSAASAPAAGGNHTAPAETFAAFLDRMRRVEWRTCVTVQPDVNVGDESLSVASFIADHYERLPEMVVFLHAHETTWHHPNIVEQLRCMCLDTRQESYRTLLTPLEHHFFTMHCLSREAHLQSDVHPAELNDRTDLHRFRVLWQRLLEPYLGPLEHSFVYDLCGSFVVTKRAMRSLPRAFWRQLATLLRYQPLSHAAAGVDGELSMLVERLWRTIFHATPYDFQRDFTNYKCRFGFEFACPPHANVSTQADIISDFVGRACPTGDLRFRNR